MSADLLVIAKEPVPGRSKTRLTPPLSPEEAASVAESALADTLQAVAATPARRRILVLEGNTGPWLPDGFEVFPQEDGGLDNRLAGAFSQSEGPALLVGMDTPQITPDLLQSAVKVLAAPSTDAVLGLAEDGGWWAIGLVAPNPEVFLGVPMSTKETGQAQAARLDYLGLSWARLPVLRDVDTIDDAQAVASNSPHLSFTETLDGIGAR